MHPWSVPARTRLLVVAPHPDDETLGCGLLLQQVMAAGGEARILLMTDGENNPWPQRCLERRWSIDALARRRWGARRREEMVHALARLGVPAAVLQPLGWPDGEVTRRLRDEPTVSIAAIRAAIQAFSPHLLCAPALEDRHPDHGAAHVLCRLALLGIEPAPLLLSYTVHGPVGATDASILIDATAEQRQRKRSAMVEHQSQMALSGRRMLRLVDRPECYRRVDGTGADGRLPWRPPAPLRRWLRLLVATPAGVREGSWRETPLMREAGRIWRLQLAGEGPAFVKLYLDWPSPWIFDCWGWWEA